MRTYIVTLSTGAAWNSGKTSREQLFWDEHVAFIDRLIAFGYILRGGPEMTRSGVQLIVQAHDAETVVDLLVGDPWLGEGLLQPPIIAESAAALNIPSAI